MIQMKFRQKNEYNHFINAWKISNAYQATYYMKRIIEILQGQSKIFIILNK